MLRSRIIGTTIVHRSAFLTATASAALAGGIAASKSSCESSIQSYDNQKSLFLPTVEAGIRALRLVHTVGLVVMDYEFAKRKLCSADGQAEMELSRMEDEMAEKETELAQAQLLYTSEQKDAELSSEQRQKLKQEQKQRMHDVAKDLAEAEQALRSMEGESGKSRLHRKAAKRILELCRKNGGVYIKVGQHLANLDYLIPQEYIEVLSSLFDEAPHSEFNDVCRVVEEDLQGKVDDLFDNFDPVPIASASLAQVHVAYDKQTGVKLAPSGASRDIDG